MISMTETEWPIKWDSTPLLNIFQPIPESFSRIGKHRLTKRPENFSPITPRFFHLFLESAPISIVAPLLWSQAGGPYNGQLCIPL
jgi:hypothetical protein